MDLNYLSFFLISFVPIIIGRFYFSSNSKIALWAGVTPFKDGFPSISKLVVLFIISLGLIYGLMNLVIHQLGFYELFFTDIMKGSKESEIIVQEFLAKYGHKHRHFGHGIMHGALNAIVFATPMVGLVSLVEGRSFKHFIYHFLYWFITVTIVCGLISAFV